ncbi:MAG: NAD(P)H-dependent oxidoreductase [Blautia sp.]
MWDCSTEVEESDVVILASPLYYWSISGQLKTVLDHLFPEQFRAVRSRRFCIF